jgi:hypothetical protein
MNVASRFAVGSVTALWFAAAIAEEPVSNEETRHLLARADVAGIGDRGSDTPVPLDTYAGRYVAAEDVAFLVDCDGDALTIDIPETLGPGRVHLQNAGVRNAFATEAGIRVVFQSDAAGRVLGLLLQTPTEVIEASKAPPRRGIVTVHDLSADAASSLRLNSLVRSF